MKHARFIVPIVLVLSLLSAAGWYGAAESAGITPKVANLVQNPSFEEDLDGDWIPDHWSSTQFSTVLYYSSRYPVSGSHSMYINPGNPDGGARSDDIPVSPGTYELSLYAYIPGDYTSQKVAVRDASNGNLLGTLKLGQTSGMTWFQATITVPSGVSAVYLDIHGDLLRPFYVDDVYFAPLLRTSRTAH